MTEGEEKDGETEKGHEDKAGRKGGQKLKVKIGDGRKIAYMGGKCNGIIS